MTRRQARESAFCLAFEMSFIKQYNAEEAFDSIIESQSIEIDDFTKQIVKKLDDNIDCVDDMITEYLKSWSLTRISKTALALLRISCVQMMYFDDLPDSVVINEAVELAKKYGADDEFSFVNGILGSISRRLHGEEGPTGSED